MMPLCHLCLSAVVAPHTGKKAPRRRTEVLPKATKLLEAREEPMELDKNMNKTVIVASGRPGFTCEMCRWTVKDSASYLDHVNGRFRESRLHSAPCTHRRGK